MKWNSFWIHYVHMMKCSLYGPVIVSCSVMNHNGTSGNAMCTWTACIPPHVDRFWRCIHTFQFTAVSFKAIEPQKSLFSYHGKEIDLFYCTLLCHSANLWLDPGFLRRTRWVKKESWHTCMLQQATLSKQRDHGHTNTAYWHRRVKAVRANSPRDPSLALDRSPSRWTVWSLWFVQTE